MLKRCSIAVLSILAMAHNAYAVIDCVRLMENTAQYIEQFKEGVHTLEDWYRRLEESGILEIMDDVDKMVDNTQAAIDNTMRGIKAMQHIQPGKIGGSFMSKLESLPALPTQPYRPEGKKDVVAKAAKQGFAGKDTIKKWVKKEIFSNGRAKDSDKPTEQQIMEEKRQLLNSMRNAAATKAYAYAVMVQLRLDNISPDEEKSSLESVSKAETKPAKLKATEDLQKRINKRINEVNKVKAKLAELSSVAAMRPDSVPLDDEEDKDKEKKGGKK